jgi:hypothetical protein
MSNVTLFKKSGIPEHLRNIGVNDLTKALAPGVNNSPLKRISIRGRVFRLVVNGEEMTKNESNSMEVVIVNASKDISRSFYAGAYDPKAEVTSPDCWSPDGVKPDASVENPQHHNCKDCPKNIKGSGTGGSRACRFSRRLALALPNDLGSVYQLVLSATSIFGTGDQEHMPFNQYLTYVVSQGFSINALVTEMKFDSNSDTPKLVFSPVRFLDEEEYEQAVRLGDTQETKMAISAPKIQAKAPAAPALAAPVKEPAVHEEEDEEDIPPPKAKKAAPAAAVPNIKPELQDILSKFAASKSKAVDDE